MERAGNNGQKNISSLSLLCVVVCETESTLLLRREGGWQRWKSLFLSGSDLCLLLDINARAQQTCTATETARGNRRQKGVRLGKMRRRQEKRAIQWSHSWGDFLFPHWSFPVGVTIVQESAGSQITQHSRSCSVFPSPHLQPKTFVRLVHSAKKQRYTNNNYYCLLSLLLFRLGLSRPHASFSE